MPIENRITNFEKRMPLRALIDATTPPGMTHLDDLYYSLIFKLDGRIKPPVVGGYLRNLSRIILASKDNGKKWLVTRSATTEDGEHEIPVSALTPVGVELIAATPDIIAFRKIMVNAGTPLRLFKKGGMPPVFYYALREELSDRLRFQQENKNK